MCALLTGGSAKYVHSQIKGMPRKMLGSKRPAFAISAECATWAHDAAVGSQSPRMNMMNMMNPMMGMMGALARACGLIPRVAPGLHLLFLINMEPGILFGDPFGFHSKKLGSCHL